MKGCGPLQHRGLVPQPLFLLSHPTAPYWDVSSVLSPVACDCNPDGSAPGPEGCDPSTGQCRCLPHVTGRTCGLCQPGYYGLQPTVGCKRCVWGTTKGAAGALLLLLAHRPPLLGASCECHPAGSLDSGCHALTGQCSCQPGVVGLRCDRCDHGFFGFSAKGCRGNRDGGHHLGPKIGAGSHSMTPSCRRCSLQLLPAGLRHAAVPREQHLRLPPRLCGLQVRAVPGQLLPRPAELPLPAVPLLLRAGEGRGTARALPRR